VNREELIDCLNDLILTCRDSEIGFETAAVHVSDPDLKAMLSDSSVQRAQFAAELESEVRMLKGVPAREKHVSSTLQRGWRNIKSILRMSDDSIVAECEREEGTALETYQRVLKNNLAPNVLPVVKHQFTEIKRSHERLRNLKKAA
jgi:uncharacterized protein (TIGR02284 family)